LSYVWRDQEHESFCRGYPQHYFNQRITEVEMKFPAWAPSSITDLIDEAEKDLQNGRTLTPSDREAIQRNAEMWTRLVTRPEMESVWRFIWGRSSFTIFATPKMLLANGGLVGTINRKVYSYETDPRMSDKDYENDLLEIARLAEGLSNKLKKYCDIEDWRNPFPPSALLTQEERDAVSGILRPEYFQHKKTYQSNAGLAGHILDSRLPKLDSLIRRLAEKAREEAGEKAARLNNLPRKVGDKNVFRTYFISIVKDYFMTQYHDYSPTRIATFCNVALDDPEITPDLVRKGFPIDAETKELLRQSKSPD
jgi:hypothetical protein